MHFCPALGLYFSTGLASAACAVPEALHQRGWSQPTKLLVRAMRWRCAEAPFRIRALAKSAFSNSSLQPAAFAEQSALDVSVTFEPSGCRLTLGDLWAMLFSRLSFYPLPALPQEAQPPALIQELWAGPIGSSAASPCSHTHLLLLLLHRLPLLS